MNEIKYIEMKKLNILTILIVIFSLSVMDGFAEKYVGSSSKSSKEIKTVGAGCLPATAFKYLEFNNVRARINNGGDMWWDFSKARYEVPKGGGVSALFAGSIWVGGTDSNGQLRLAAHKFRSAGNDFFPGPLVADRESPNVGNVSTEVCTRYDQMYYVTRVMVSEFLAYKQSENPTLDFPEYKVPEVINNWPGNHDYSIDDDGYDMYLAPFRDVDGDGVYSPAAGDYPYYIFDSKNYDCNSVPKREADSLNSEDMPLFGDATIWWVYNDRGNIHTETGGEAIGMEFRAQAFAFATNDELNNMTFYNYQIINRSSFTLKNTYFGVWTDADLGNAFDDFVGCDVQRGLGYLYNGDDNDEDGSSPGYGKNPPAIGIDFFEGPYKDATGKDDFSSYNPNGDIDCANGYADSNGDGFKDSVVAEPNTIFNGNINGLNFGDGVADNERWGMRRFIFFNNETGDYGDPTTAAEYYRYLTGFWANGKRMTYGGTGYSGGTDLEADFMFPGDSDPCNWGTRGVIPSGYEDGSWTEVSEGNTPADRRLVQSAGPFTLEPGMVNYITTGAVWARAFDGGLLASANAVRKADDKAQALFEQCFQMIDGPDAPDMTFIPMDGKFIVHLSNLPISNNYLEQYVQEDYFISTAYTDRDYRFQGYQVYQLKNLDVTLDQLQDESYARVIFQCDLKDKVGDLVNFVYDEEISGNHGQVMVRAANAGLRHTFEITADAFASGSQRGLINNQKYYYLAVAYAHNQYKKYDATNGDALDGQITPYLASRKSVRGELKVLEQIPHPRNMDDNGTVLNADYGTQPPVTLVEGKGGTQSYLTLVDGLEERILNGENIAGELAYNEDNSPLDVRIIDPFNIKPGEYYVGLCADSINFSTKLHHFEVVNGSELEFYNANNVGHIRDTKWFLGRMNAEGVMDTLYISDTWISQKNEIMFDTLGISIDIEQFSFAMSKKNYGVCDAFTKDNGFIGAKRSYANEEEPWLDFIPDQEGANFLNWIRAGETAGAGVWSDIFTPEDRDAVYEGILGGTWGPVRLTSDHTHGPRPDQTKVLFQANDAQYAYTSSVDIVFTKNRDLWTRVPVLEMTDHTRNDAGLLVNPNSENNVLKFRLRGAPSLDKDGMRATGGGKSSNPNDANYLSDSGWSWFPGYAIDVNNGKRLNMAFGEASELVGYNGRDMLWNPVGTIVSEDGNYIMGGKHYVYVFAADEKDPHNAGSFVLPGYEDVEFFSQQLHANREQTLAFMSWVSLPVIRRGYEFVDYADMPDNDFRVEIRVARPYGVSVGVDALSNPLNANYPLYKFSLDQYVPIRNNKPMAESALKSVNIVPNPYYAGNSYQLSPLDFTVKIINLPAKCDVKIFNMAGTLVRSYSKDNSSTIIEWDLKNNYQVPIAGGLYIIHINAPGVGEKTLKWFGVLRPDDLTSF